MPTITATTYDDTFGVVSVTKYSSRPYTYAVIRVSDTGDVSASFHLTRDAADKAAGRPSPGVTRHVVPVEKRGIVLDPSDPERPFKLAPVSTYSIIRFFADDRPTDVIVRGLTLEQAKAHCNRADSHGEDWFDGYTKEPIADRNTPQKEEVQ